MAKVLLVCGSTGAGKTTFCRETAAKTQAMVFSIDEWMADLFVQDMPSPQNFAWILERVARCEGVIWKQCLDLNERGIDVVLDFGFSTAKKRQLYYHKLSAAGLSYELNYLDIPKEIRLARVLSRNERKNKTFQFEVTETMFNYIESIFEPPSDEELSVNNGKKIR